MPKARRIIVTGAGAGIGRASAAHLADLGYQICALDRDVDALNALTLEIPAIEAFHVDVTDPENMALAFDRINDGGPVSGVVCAAGIQTYGDVTDPDALEVFDKTFDVNVRGVFTTAHFGIPLLQKNGEGSFVIVSSVQAYLAQQGVPAYAATKGALLALVRAMAVDYAPQGIRVNGVCPGSVDTPMLRNAAKMWADPGEDGQLLQKWGAAHPLGRVGTAKEVAMAIAFLLGEEAAFVTGADLKVDGGLSAGNAVEMGE